MAWWTRPAGRANPWRPGSTLAPASCGPRGGRSCPRRPRTSWSSGPISWATSSCPCPACAACASCSPRPALSGCSRRRTPISPAAPVCSTRSSSSTSPRIRRSGGASCPPKRRRRCDGGSSPTASISPSTSPRAARGRCCACRERASSMASMTTTGRGLRAASRARPTTRATARRSRRNRPRSWPSSSAWAPA